MATVQQLAVGLYRLGPLPGRTDVQELRQVIAFLAERWDIPITLSVLYLTLVYATRNIIPEHRFAKPVDACFAAWNLFLAVFSWWGVYNMSRTLNKIIRHEGFFYTVCSDTPGIVKYCDESPLTQALCLFCLSKVPELMDTVFLILKRKPVRLLQWYHHVTVMLFCWLALATEYTPGIWFAVTNYFVHGVMYLYFFLMSFKKAQKVVRIIAPAVTVLQISQMVWGLIVNGIAIYSFLQTGNCQIQAVTVYCAIAMYASYFWLFGKLFLDSQRSKRRAKSLKEGVANGAAEGCNGKSEANGKVNGETNGKINGQTNGKAKLNGQTNGKDGAEKKAE